jgi:hypothetical protein
MQRFRLERGKSKIIKRSIYLFIIKSHWLTVPIAFALVIGAVYFTNPFFVFL